MENEDGRGKEMAAFLIKHHLDQLRSIILSSDPRLHYPLHVEYVYALTRFVTLFGFSDIDLQLVRAVPSYSQFYFIFCNSFAELMDDNPPLAYLIFEQPKEFLPLFDESAVWAQVSFIIYFQFVYIDWHAVAGHKWSPE